VILSKTCGPNARTWTRTYEVIFISGLCLYIFNFGSFSVSEVTPYSFEDFYVISQAFWF